MRQHHDHRGTVGRDVANAHLHRLAALALAGACVLPAETAAQVVPGAVASVPQAPSAGLPPGGPANLVPQGSPIPRVLPPPLPTAGPGPAPLPPVTPLAVPNVDRRVTSVTVVGATAFSQPVLDRLTAGLIGPMVPQPRIEAVREALLNRYRSRGFVYTAVSAVLSGTELRFVVSEGHISDIKLEGDIGPAGTQVLHFLDHLRDLRPVSTAAIERWLLLASDIPGVTVRSVLRPAPDDPGALILIAQVTRKVVSGLATADNRGFTLAGPEEFLGVLDVNSLSQFGERTELSIFRSFNDTQVFGQASEEAFLGSSGLRLRVYGGAGNNQPSGVLREIDYDGDTRIFGAQLSYPVIRARQQTLNVYGVFDGVESDVTSISTTPRSYDSLRVLRAGLDYAYQDVIFGAAHGAVDAALLRVSQGLTTLGASHDDDTDLPRPGERINFTKVNAELSRTQALFSPYPDASVALVGTLAGQYSGDVLPPAETFFLGGPRFDRGFYSGEVTGDNALVGSLELQLDTPLRLSLPVETSAQFYAFLDWGETWERTDEDADHVLSSTGLGSRFFVTPYTEFDVEGVARLTRHINGADASELKGEAVYWRVLVRF